MPEVKPAVLILYDSFRKSVNFYKDIILQKNSCLIRGNKLILKGFKNLNRLHFLNETSCRKYCLQTI